MLTLSQARKKLGKNSDTLSDEQLQKEIEISEFLATLILELYKRPNYYFKENTKNGLQS